MKVTKRMFALIAIVGSFFVGSNAFGQGGNTASDTGTATASVIASLTLTNTEDLEFGEGIQGDAAYTPNTPFRAIFNVTGEPDRFFNVNLPADSTVVMTTGAGGTNETIAVDSFITGGGTQKQLGSGGIAAFLVGATRAALGASQVPGLYSATFTVSIIYQ